LETSPDGGRLVGDSVRGACRTKLNPNQDRFGLIGTDRAGKFRVERGDAHAAVAVRVAVTAPPAHAPTGHTDVSAYDVE
jgi:hypothetical protein